MDVFLTSEVYYFDNNLYLTEIHWLLLSYGGRSNGLPWAVGILVYQYLDVSVAMLWIMWKY